MDLMLICRHFKAYQNKVLDESASIKIHQCIEDFFIFRTFVAFSGYA